MGNADNNNKSIYGSLQHKAVYAAQMTKWKVDQQARLLKLASEINVLEKDIRERKIKLADETMSLYQKGQIQASTLKELCDELESVLGLAEKKRAQKYIIETESAPLVSTPSSAAVAAKLVDTPNKEDRDASIETLLTKADIAFLTGDIRNAGIFANQILQIDFVNLSAWQMIQKITGDTRDLYQFRIAFAKKYFPEKAHLVEIPIRQSNDTSASGAFRLSAPVDSIQPIKKTDIATENRRPPLSKNVPDNVKLPGRGFNRIFTIAGLACFGAPWVLISRGCSGSIELNGGQVLLANLQSQAYMNAVIAVPAIILLVMLIFVTFRSRNTQKWIERASISLSALAAVPAIDIIFTYYAHASASVTELKWGIWASWGSFALIGLASIVNARKIGKFSEESARQVSTIAARGLAIISMGTIIMIVGLSILGAMQTPNIGPNLLLVGMGPPLMWLILALVFSLRA